MIAGARLALLSGLSGVSAGAHLYSIRQAGGTAGQILVSRSTLSTATAGQHLMDEGTATAGGSFSGEIELQRPGRKWYVKRKKQLHIFDTPEQADAFIEADAAAELALAKLAQTSRRTRKRIKQRIYRATAAEPSQTVQIDAIADMVERFNIAADLPALLEIEDYAQFMEVVAMALEMQEEEDIEMLLLA
jgi:hypothetical protein